jgi:hypothetical protein
MSPVIKEVKGSAISFHEKLEEKMKRKQKRIDQLRARVIVFRDYWSDSKEEAMLCSDFFPLPSEAPAFTEFVSRIRAEGGDDEPENALEALALTLNSPWEKTQDFAKQRYIVLMWTDASAHALEKEPKPSNYPTNLPKTIEELTECWEGMPLSAKRLLLFTPDVEPWSKIRDSWENVIHFPSQAGRGLEDFEMEQILDAIAGSV